jgi:hypothetical protein
MSYNIKTHGDFKRYYDTTQKRNYWVLGYFGGGAVNITEAYKIAKQYAKAVNVPLNTVKIDEILHSRRHKGFKYVYSNNEQKYEIDAIPLENVFEWLSN